MASLQAVAAGFVVAPSRDREREYLEYLVDHGEGGVPLEGAIYDIRLSPTGERVVLLPLRSYETARRLLKLFESASKSHQKAERERRKFGINPREFDD
jgi:hypothetical protein